MDAEEIARRCEARESAIAEFVEKKQWQEALRELVALQDVEHGESGRLDELAELSGLESEALRREGTPSSLCLLGRLLRFGWGDAEHDRGDSLRCFERAGEMGHARALYYLGFMKKFDGDPEGGFACYMRSARLGCRDAVQYVAIAYCEGEGVDRSYLQAAQWFLHGGYPSRLERLLLSHPYECTPFGEWRPEAPLQQLVMPEVRASQRCWMGVAKRLAVSRGVAVMISGYVCTRSGWEALAFSDE